MIVYKVATHIFIQIFPSILRSQLIVMSNLIVFKHCRACIRVPNKYGDIFDLFLFVWRIMSSILFPLGFLRRFRHFDHTFLSTEKKSISRENAQYWPDIYSTFDFGGVKKAPHRSLNKNMIPVKSEYFVMQIKYKIIMRLIFTDFSEWISCWKNTNKSRSIQIKNFFDLFKYTVFVDWLHKIELQHNHK